MQIYIDLMRSYYADIIFTYQPRKLLPNMTFLKLRSTPLVDKEEILLTLLIGQVDIPPRIRQRMANSVTANAWYTTVYNYY